MVSKLTSFSLTVHTRRNGLKMRIFSNFGLVIHLLYSRKLFVEVPKAPRQAFWTGSDDLIPLTGNGKNTEKNTILQRELSKLSVKLRYRLEP